MGWQTSDHPKVGPAMGTGGGIDADNEASAIREVIRGQEAMEGITRSTLVCCRYRILKVDDHRLRARGKRLEDAVKPTSRRK